MPIELKHADVFDFVWSQLQESKPSNSLFELWPGNIYQSETEPRFKNLSFRLQIASYDRTLTDSEVNKLLDAVATIAKHKFDAERI